MEGYAISRAVSPSSEGFFNSANSSPVLAGSGAGTWKIALLGGRSDTGMIGLVRGFGVFDTDFFISASRWRIFESRSWRSWICSSQVLDIR